MRILIVIINNNVFAFGSLPAFFNYFPKYKYLKSQIVEKLSRQKQDFKNQEIQIKRIKIIKSKRI